MGAEVGGATVAVLDVGKSNVKLSACTADGHVVETLALPNAVLPGPPWRHYDLAEQNALWLDESACPFAQDRFALLRDILWSSN